MGRFVIISASGEERAPYPLGEGAGGIMQIELLISEIKDDTLRFRVEGIDDHDWCGSATEIGARLALYRDCGGQR